PPNQPTVTIYHSQPTLGGAKFPIEQNPFGIRAPHPPQQSNDGYSNSNSGQYDQERPKRPAFYEMEPPKNLNQAAPPNQKQDDGLHYDTYMYKSTPGNQKPGQGGPTQYSNNQFDTN